MLIEIILIIISLILVILLIIELFIISCFFITLPEEKKHKWSYFYNQSRKGELFLNKYNENE